jgi:hypothetical protein
MLQCTGISSTGKKGKGKGKGKGKTKSTGEKLSFLMKTKRMQDKKRKQEGTAASGAAAPELAAPAAKVARKLDKKDATEEDEVCLCLQVRCPLGSLRGVRGRSVYRPTSF